MICARCDKPLKSATAMPVDKLSDSGPGLTVYVHKVLCVAPPRQTSPVSKQESIREG